jgi:hypothetical protein
MQHEQLIGAWRMQHEQLIGAWRMQHEELIGTEAQQHVKPSYCSSKGPQDAAGFAASSDKQAEGRRHAM